MANENEAPGFEENGNTGEMGHVEMGHVEMGRRRDLGHVEMGHVEMGPAPRGAGAGGGRVFLGGSSRETGVVVRATVESYGPVGETELQVNVKWPAGCNSAPVVEPVKRTGKPPGGSANVA